jgi:hypothetical protein
MKTCTSLCLAGLLAASLCTAGPARAGGADAPWSSLVTEDDLGYLSVGVSWEKSKRRMQGQPFGEQTLESRDLYATFSVDLFPWMTVFGGAGQTEVKPAPQLAYLESEPMWLGGARLNLFEHDILRPAFLESIFRIQLLGMVVEHEGEFAGRDVEWTEYRYAAMARLEVFPEQWAIDREQVPFSVDFFAGPVMSDIKGDYLPRGADIPPNDDFKENDDVGFLLGFDINVARHFSVGYEARVFERGAHNINAAFHF